FLVVVSSPRAPRCLPTRRSSDLQALAGGGLCVRPREEALEAGDGDDPALAVADGALARARGRHQEVGAPPAPLRDHARDDEVGIDRKSTRLNSSHVKISYAVFCL